jgi:2-keto-4-pentenoate hydratase/2-oxohepta-3-ene-1,7-dioic acid hydratase in catechol pathway
MTWFALGTFDGGQEPFAGLVLSDDAVHPLGAGTTVRRLVDRWEEELPGLQRLADRVAGGHVPYWLAELRPLPPVLPVGQIFQAGANYRTHVLQLLEGAERRGDSSDGWGSAEREQARRALDDRAANGAPFVFTGCMHAMVGAQEDIVLPTDFTQPDWELELAAVIGRAGRRVPVERALEHVAGYTICNDVTLRDALRRPDVPGGFDWLAAKNAPTFLPTGPLLVPAVHAGDPMALRIELAVNGRLMQDEMTADMMFDVARLVAHVSTIAELRPGDLLLTGSPAGNGASHGVFLQPGDVMEGSITGLGTQRNRCVAERHAVVPA